MKLPRDLSGEDLVKALAIFGYAVDRQTGSHIRLTTQLQGEHHITIPAHDPLKVGTLNAIRLQAGGFHPLRFSEGMKSDTTGFNPAFLFSGMCLQNSI